MTPLDGLTEVGFVDGSHLLDCTNHSGNMTVIHKPTNMVEISVKEVIIVIGMLGLWFYSILLGRKAWYKAGLKAGKI